MGRDMQSGTGPNGGPGFAGFADGPRMTKPAYNRLLVCASLFHEGPASRVGLRRRTGVAMSRLSEICGELIRGGLIRECEEAPAAGENGQGRPQTMLEVNLRGLGV